MQDLNAVMFYKAKFRIRPAEGTQCDLLWKVILGIRLWLTKKWNRDGHCIVDPQMALDPLQVGWEALRSGGYQSDLRRVSPLCSGGGAGKGALGLQDHRKAPAGKGLCTPGMDHGDRA